MEEQSKKAVLYKYMFLISTVSGVMGVFALLKDFKIVGWILVVIWAILAVLVRVFIMRDKKFLKNKKM